MTGSRPAGERRPTRRGETIFPQAGTRVEAGDVAVLVADPPTEAALRAFLQGSAGRGSPPPAERAT